VEIEDQQYSCSNRDQLSVRIILGTEELFKFPDIPHCWLKSTEAPIAMLIVFCGGVHAEDGKARYMSLEPKITCSKIFIFQSILLLEFQKHLSLYMLYKFLSERTICEISFFHFSQGTLKSVPVSKQLITKQT
jgi:hypothetical protein